MRENCYYLRGRFHSCIHVVCGAIGLGFCGCGLLFSLPCFRGLTLVVGRIRFTRFDSRGVRYRPDYRIVEVESLACFSSRDAMQL